METAQTVRKIQISCPVLNAALNGVTVVATLYILRINYQQSQNSGIEVVVLPRMEATSVLLMDINMITMRTMTCGDTTVRRTTVMLRIPELMMVVVAGKEGLLWTQGAQPQRPGNTT